MIESLVMTTSSTGPHYWLKVRVIETGVYTYIRYRPGIPNFDINKYLDTRPEWSWVFRRDTVVGDRMATRLEQGYPRYIFDGEDGGPHNGIDITADSDSMGNRRMRIIDYPIFSPISGKIIGIDHFDSNTYRGFKWDETAKKWVIHSTNPSKDLGNFVRIESNCGRYIVTLAHLEFKPLVNLNDIVTPHTLIGIAGNTGLSDGYHLHIEIKEDSSFINPKTKFPNIVWS